MPVRLRLDATGYHCDHGRITLQGRVATYFLKQVAHTVVQTAIGTPGLIGEMERVMVVRVHGSH